jgi:hypothetical protein
MLESLDELAVDAGEVEEALMYLVLDPSLYDTASRCYNLCFFALHFGRYCTWPMIIMPLVIQACSPHSGLIRYCTSANSRTATSS